MSEKYISNATLWLTFFAVVLFSSCQNNPLQPQNAPPPAMRDVPAVRLNYKYEADVPPPSAETGKPAADERDAAVQSDFDTNRTFELLERTIPSPDRKHTLAVYRNIADVI